MSSPHDAFASVAFVTGAEGAGEAFTGPADGGWHPNDGPQSPADPHGIPYDDIGGEIEPVDGEVPDNIVDDGEGEFDCVRSHGRLSAHVAPVPGPFSRLKQG
jgi:hypothetical protein